MNYQFPDDSSSNQQTTNDANSQQMPQQWPNAWQSELNFETRQHLVVQKIVHAIFPHSISNVPPQDRRLTNLCTYAKKVESDIFEKANSREEYYHLIEEKIVKIQNELEEKRQRRRELQQLEQQSNQSAPNVQVQVNSNPVNSVNLQQNLPQQTSNNLNANSQQIKDWQSVHNSDARGQLVQKIVEAIFPNANSHLPPQDRRLINLFAYAKIVESAMYEKANSREEYNHLLAEKIYKIQKELEEKSQRRHEQQQLQQANQFAPNARAQVNSNLIRFNSNLANSANLQPNSSFLGAMVAPPNAHLFPQELEVDVVESVSDLMAQLEITEDWVLIDLPEQQE